MLPTNVIFSEFWFLLSLTLNLLNFKPKFCLKTTLHGEKLHFLVSFSFERQLKVCQNDPEQVFEGDIFAQIVAISQWHTLDQTLVTTLILFSFYLLYLFILIILYCMYTMFMYTAGFSHIILSIGHNN